VSNHDLLIVALILVDVFCTTLINHINNKRINLTNERLDAMSARLDSPRIHLILKQK